MVRLSDHSESEASYAEFLERRQRERRAAARELASLRNDRRALAADLAASRAAVADEMAATASLTERLGRAGRAGIGTVTRFFEDRDPALARIDREIRRIELVYGGAARRSAVHAMRDQSDFERLAIGDRANLVDPVLVGVPGTRAFRQDGWTVYRRSSHGSELLRASATEIVVRSSDDYAVRAAVALAAHRHEPPLALEGSAQFVERAARAARDLGVPFVLPGTQEIVHPETPGPTRTGPAPSATSSAEPTAKSTTTGSAGAFSAEKLEQLKADLKADFVGVLTPDPFKAVKKRAFFVHSRTGLFAPDHSDVVVLQPDPVVKAYTVAVLGGDAVEPGKWVDVQWDGPELLAGPMTPMIDPDDPRLRTVAAQLGSEEVKPLDGDWLASGLAYNVHSTTDAFKPEHPSAVVLHSLEADKYFVAVFPDGSAMKVGDRVTVAWDDAKREYGVALFDPLAPPDGRDDGGDDRQTDGHDHDEKGRGR